MKESDAKTILIVDDDAIIATLESMQLRDDGYRVIHVNSGELAYDTVCLGKEQIDLILMDIDLGDGNDGTVIAQKILGYREIPIIFVSSHTEPEIVRKTEDISSYGYVMKNAGYIVLKASIQMAFKLNKLIKEQRNTKNALSAALNNLSLVFDSIDEMVFVVSSDGKIITENESVLVRLGYTREELKDREVLSLYADLDAPLSPIENDSCVSGTLLAKTGRRIDVETRITRGLWDNLAVNIQVARDVSERKRANDEIRTGKERFAKIFNSSPAPIFISELESGVYLDVNEKYCELVGYSYDELVGSSSVDLGIWMDGESRPRVIEWLTREGSLKNVSVRIQTKTKELHDVMWSAEIITLQSRKVMLSLLFDITESKKHEAALRESADNYRDLINAMNETVWVIDLDGNIIDVNESAMATLMYSKNELLQIGLAGIDALHSREQILEFVNKMPRDGVQRFETSHRKKDGTVIPVEISSSLVSYQGKQSILSIARDITVLKENEERINALLREKELILKEVHHRIKNNMNTISALLNLQALSEKDGRVSQVLLDSAGRVQIMQTIYENLYCQGKMENLKAETYFTVLIGKINSVFQKDERMKVNYSIEPLIISSKILTPLGIITNELMTNTIKYVLNRQEIVNIGISLSREDDVIRYTYRDDGPGLQPDFNEKANTGFGMNIVRMLTQQMGGSVEFLSPGGILVAITILEKGHV